MSDDAKFGYSMFFLVGYTVFMFGIGVKFGAWIGFVLWGGILSAACALLLLAKEEPASTRTSHPQSAPKPEFKNQEKNI